MVGLLNGEHFLYSLRPMALFFKGMRRGERDEKRNDENERRMWRARIILLK
jgi:hypothetical protein